MRAIGHARWIHKGHFVVKKLDLLVVCDFAGAGYPDFYQGRGCVTAKEDTTHAPRAVGRIARMVFGVFHYNQASGAVQQQLGVKVQDMRLCLRERSGHLVREHDVTHGHVHGCCL
jgi:hypothetical protein